MYDLLTFIYANPSPTARLIVWVITTVFALGILDILVQFFKLRIEKMHLEKAIHLFKHQTEPVSPEDLLLTLEADAISPKSTVFRRIAAILEIRAQQGIINQDLLAEIDQGKMSTKGSFASYLTGNLVVLGLIGTVWGLSGSVIKVQLLLSDKMLGFDAILEALSKTLNGMGTSFATTLLGLITSLMLGLALWFLKVNKTLFSARLEAFFATALLPLFQFQETSSIAGLQTLGETLQRACERMQQAATRQTATLAETMAHLSETPWVGVLGQQATFVQSFQHNIAQLETCLQNAGTQNALIQSAMFQFKEIAEHFQSLSHNSESELRQHLVGHFATLAEQNSQAAAILQQGQEQNEQLIRRLYQENADTQNALIENAMLQLKEMAEQFQSLSRSSESELKQHLVGHFATLADQNSQAAAILQQGQEQNQQLILKLFEETEAGKRQWLDALEGRASTLQDGLVSLLNQQEHAQTRLDETRTALSAQLDRNEHHETQLASVLAEGLSNQAEAHRQSLEAWSSRLDEERRIKDGLHQELSTRILALAQGQERMTEHLATLDKEAAQRAQKDVETASALEHIVHRIGQAFTQISEALTQRRSEEAARQDRILAAMEQLSTGIQTVTAPPAPAPLEQSDTREISPDLVMVLGRLTETLNGMSATRDQITLKHILHTLQRPWWGRLIGRRNRAGDVP